MYYFKIKNNIKVPVSKEIYSQINSIQNRTNYTAKKLKESGLIYYETYSSENNTGESRIKDYSALSTETVIKEHLYNALYDALATLSIDDQLLLYKLYVNNSSLRGAMHNNLNHPTKVKRHQEMLLKKLAILLKEYEEDFFDNITR
ncbi:hypothetical protein [uncultured Gemella sp.]|uniref:hypothetical protein n=1 Tax=uncultured Gemella sp. TaxID=254352 RepID=UPI0028D4FF9E|nr:hypothetical protein [uncultured Gemella sp.]